MSELGEFLRLRRGRVQPSDVGLPEHGRRRRVPGLRREEVAQLAGVSVDYYVRLEQGRGDGVSAEVLDAVARVLRLDATERRHLHDLARPPRGAPRRTPTQVRPGLRLVLDALDSPAFVLGRCMDVLAWNALGDAVVGFSALPPAGRNTARHAFLTEAGRSLYPEYERVAAETAAFLRLDAARHPDDPELAALVAELTAGSPLFAELWARHGVQEKSHGRKLLRHPLVGDLDLGYETLAPPGEPGLHLVVYTAEPGSATAERLARLAVPARV
ncbi:helix-turn-helix transcriptional regulator [Streptomyces sp. TLI_171]|uniref:helix-turn-helix transcriptional regulator n=1 Tax=Streptomyces sp. TLI_171 TaxID=1938859 RepID=UPI000C1987D9|nr:helix-turn-helix transcriptional regulator [Streptomyces sp. TLI_171]RKE20015.1 helix-turn-helix protein [Streptomyces sp. TLI_171]